MIFVHLVASWNWRVGEDNINIKYMAGNSNIISRGWTSVAATLPNQYSTYDVDLQNCACLIVGAFDLLKPSIMGRKQSYLLLTMTRYKRKKGMGDGGNIYMGTKRSEILVVCQMLHQFIPSSANVTVRLLDI